MTALHPGPDGWRLAPEGAALDPTGRTAVVADVHLGYEWARADGGDVVPPHSLAETLARLEALHVRCPDLSRLVVAGDLVESSSFCPRTRRDVTALTAWLAARGIELVRLAGNHDPAARPPLPDSIAVAGWTIAHGHRPVTGRAITGHHHPALRADGLTAPCFLVGSKRIVLPAFSPNAAGWNVASGALPDELREAPLRCVVPAGTSWFDFGPIADLPGRLRGQPVTAPPRTATPAGAGRSNARARPGRTRTGPGRS